MNAQFDILFENEITAYTHIVPLLSDADAVKCYYSYRKKLEAGIVLGDFVPLGYRMSKQRANLSLQHILVSCKHLFYSINYRSVNFLLMHIFQ